LAVSVVGDEELEAALRDVRRPALVASEEQDRASGVRTPTAARITAL
jgi:hypothetical protein